MFKIVDTRTGLAVKGYSMIVDTNPEGKNAGVMLANLRKRHRVADRANFQLRAI